MKKLLLSALVALGLCTPASAQLTGTILGQVQMPPNTVLGNNQAVTGGLNAIPFSALASALAVGGISNPILNAPWTTPPNTEANNFGVPKQSGNPTWSGTGHIAGTAFTIDSNISGVLTAGMTLVGNGILPGTTLVSGSGNAWTLSKSVTVSTEAMTAEGVYGCAGPTCSSGVTNNQFMTSATTARPIGTLMQSYDGQTIPGGLSSGDLPAFALFPYYIMIAADTAGGGLPNVGLLNLANGQNSKNTFLVSANGGGGFQVGFNADCFTCNSGVFPHYGLVITRDQEIPTALQTTMVAQFTANAAYGRCTSNGTIPANNSTLNLGGTTVTFVTGTPSGNQVQIGANMRSTLTNLQAFLSGSVDANIVKTAWINDGELTFTGQSKLVGSVANSYVLSTAGGSNFTCPGTLTGGGGNGLNVTGNATYSQNADLSTTQVIFANGVPVNFGTSGFASSGSGNTTGGFTNTGGTLLSTGNGITTSGSGSGFVGNRRDNNASAFDLFSAAGEFGVFMTSLGSNALTITTGGLVQAVNAVQTGTTTVGGLPTCNAGLKGGRYFVTDANAAMSGNYGATLTGGGANNVPVVCDGAAWRQG